VSYRAATIANMHSDERASASALHQEAVFLQQAGWKETSSDRFGSIIRASDGCQLDAVGGKEKK
jgi:hypothetical protein